MEGAGVLGTDPDHLGSFLMDEPEEDCGNLRDTDIDVAYELGFHAGYRVGAIVTSLVFSAIWLVIALLMSK